MAEHPKDLPSGPDPFEGLHLTDFDQAFASILEEVAEAQELINEIPEGELTEETINRILEPLNELWAATNWPETLVYVSGTLRFECEYNTDRQHYREITKDWQKIEKADDAVEFKVGEVPLICGYFDVVRSHPDDEDDEDESMHTPSQIRYGRSIQLTFAYPGDYDEDDGFDPDFAIYPRDITYMHFSNPSIDAIKTNLKNYFPDIFRQINDLFPDTRMKDDAIGAALKRFAVSADDRIYHGYEIREALAAYLFHVIDFDDEYYEVRVDGPVRTIDAHEGPCDTSNHGVEIKYRGAIVGIIIRDDGEECEPMLRPSLLMAIPQIEHSGNFFALEVPAESLTALRNLRTRRTGFGSRALYNFESPQDVARYFASDAGDKGLEDEGQQSPKDDDGIFADIISPIKDELKNIEYDERLGCYLLPLAGDISTILTDFRYHVAAFEEVDIDTPLSEHDYGLIGSHMNKTLQRLDTMRADDMLVVRNGATIIDETIVDHEGVGQSNVLFLEPGQQLQGTLVNLVINTVPEMAFYDDGDIENIRTSVGVGVLLKDCIVIDEYGEAQSAVFGTSTVMVVLDPSASTELFKVDYIQSLGLEDDSQH